MSSLSLAQQSAALFVNISTGVVGVNTLSACNVTISGTTVGGGGGFGGVGVLANVGWTPTTDPPLRLTLPAGGAFTTASSNAQHRWIGNDLGYSFSITGTVTAAATNPAQDYKISVPYPVAIAASYPIDTIVGDLWLSVAYGTNSNFFKAYARTLSTDANSLVVRAITGSTDESLGTLLAGSVITLQGTATYATTTVNQNSGGALAAGLQTVWIPSTAVNWAPTPTPPAFTLPAGAALTYSRCNARYMYVGTDVTYNVDIGGTLTSSPTSAASDYQLSVPYPVALSTYTNPTIVGELWLSVVNGANSNTFKSYARTLTGASSNTVTLRMLTGTADEAFGVLTSGSAFTLQGTLKYTTTIANSNIGVPTSYVAADFKQNVYGDVGLNTGTSNVRGKLDIVHSSNTPALVVDQYGAGDALQVRDGGVVKMVVDANGNVGIGTGTPASKLDVNGNINYTNKLFRNGAYKPFAHYYIIATASSTEKRLNYTTSLYDTHNAVTTGTNWVFITPITGIYHLAACCLSYNNIAISHISVYVNNQLYKRIASVYTQASFLNGSTVIKLLTGDSVYFVASNYDNQAGDISWCAISCLELID